MKQSELNHLRRLLGWVRTEIGQSPDEVVDTAKVIANAGIEIDEHGKEALVRAHDTSRSTPKYVRAAVRALSAMIGGRGAVVEAAPDVHNALFRIKKLVDCSGQDGWKDERAMDVSRGRILAIVDEAMQTVSTAEAGLSTMRTVTRYSWATTGMVRDPEGGWVLQSDGQPSAAPIWNRRAIGVSEDDVGIVVESRHALVKGQNQ